MKGIKYSIKVYDDALNLVHGFGKKVEEIFLPEAGIALNKYNIFRSDEKRYSTGNATKLEEVIIDDGDVKTMIIHLETKSVIDKYIK